MGKLCYGLRRTVARGVDGMFETMQRVIGAGRGNKEVAMETKAEGGEEFLVGARALLESMVNALVDDQEAIKIEIVNGDSTTVFSVGSHRDDLGKLIGRQGKNAHALRTILGAYAAKHDRRAVLEIADERPRDREDRGYDNDRGRGESRGGRYDRGRY